MEDVRSKLLDLTRANRLLNHKVDGARNIQVVEESPGEIFRMLVDEGKTMQFLAAEENNGGAGRLTDRKLQTTLSAEKLRTKLLAIARDAKAGVDEQGCNLLYMTLGIVEWRAAGEVEEVNRAPLIFIPVQLERSNANSRHFVSMFEDEVLTNPCLLELARQDFQFTLPPFDEDGVEGAGDYLARAAGEIAKLKGWTYSDEIHLGIFSFAKMMMWRDLDDKRWPAEKAISKNSLVQRLRGESTAAEPDDAPCIREEELDAKLKPTDCFHVMDADSSQHAAIEAVKGGANMVIEGPPGTGKSQTITNIIAECMAAEKTVLFVAEKSAALDVVKKRLEDVGLGDAVLALHSKNTNKVAVMDELRRVLEQPTPAGAAGNGSAESLLALRERLRAYHDQVHQPVGRLKLSVYQAVGEIIRWSNEPEAPGAVPTVLDWDQTRLDAAREQMQTLGRRCIDAGVREGHPWRGARLKTLPLEARQTLPGLAENAAASLNKLTQDAAKLSQELATGHASAMPGIHALLKSARVMLAAPVMEAAAIVHLDAAGRDKLVAWQKMFERHNSEKAVWTGAFQDSAEAVDWGTWLEHRAAGGGMFSFLSSQWRADGRLLKAHLKKGIRPAREEELRLVRAVMVSRATRAEITQAGDDFAPLLGGNWTGWDSDRQQLKQAVARALEVADLIIRGAVGMEAAARITSGDRTALYNATDATEAAMVVATKTAQTFWNLCDATEETWFPGGWQRTALGEAARSFQQAGAAINRLESWVDLNAATEAARHGPAAAFVDWALQKTTDGQHVGGAFMRQFYRLWVEAALTQLPAVKAWRGDDYPAMATRFKELDRAWIQATRTRLRALVEAKRPEIAVRTPRDSEMGLIKGELRKKKRFMPLRKLLAHAGATVQTIKPCFMMSPISVAQYLTPGAIEFDVVIFDEASQVKPADAFGAIGRGRQLVLVGDEKQLPPTSFFNRVESDSTSDDEPTAIGDIESILGLGAARLGMSRQLRWHYRSRHSSLIQFSNEKFYGGALRVFPSPQRDCTEMGLQFHFVDGGIYKRGSGRYNEVEARAVALAVMDQARRFPDLSLGVGTLNLPQAEAIQDELETLRRAPENAALEAFFDDKRRERFFVKNLENIQGDEREVMFLSVGFGFDAAHKLTGNFGALNGDGGWRRLNVFATRARQRCVIFSSIHSDDIRIEKSSPRGVTAFKEYLYAAQNGQLREAAVPGRDHDSPFEADVCQALRDRGWTVDAQVGCAGFSIDLGVRDPQAMGRYLLGIECDGDTYHRGATARDRDRLRQEVLEGQGWNIHRIWSTDWYHRRNVATARLVAKLESLRGGEPAIPITPERSA